MDTNAVLAVFLLFLIVADASNVKFRKLAAASPEKNSTSIQVSGENKPDPKQIDAAKKPENDQVQSNSSQLDSKPDLVSSPFPNQPINSRENFNSTNLESQPPVQNQTMNNEKSLKRFNNTNDGKNSKNSSGTTMSHPGKGEIPKHVNGTDLLSPSPVGKMDNGKKNGGKETGIWKNGGNEKGNERNGGNETGNGKSGGNETGNGKNGGNETDNERNGGNERDNGNNGGNGTDNGKNGKINDTNIDDKSREKNIDDKRKEKNIDDKSISELVVNETCDGLPKCADLKTLIACIQNFDTGSRELTVLVQNGGENTLRVNLTIPTAVENPLKPLKVSKHQTQKIKILLSVVKNTKLILNAGNGECVLHTDHPESEENVFIYLPSYDKLVTPINGAYFLILSVLVFGGTWACCKFRKKRWHDGVPYQELEMGLPESASVMNVETAEGWDEGWDDDWDENNAVKSPAAPRIGSISANGLTSRSPNRDGWENDWDD